jgi:homoserine kinase type II
MDLAGLGRLWPGFGAWQVRKEEHAANNWVRVVDTAAGSFVLRFSQHQQNAGRVRYEHEVVRQLQGAGLPFRVPAPVLTAEGETFARVEVEGHEVLVSLWPLVAGNHPDMGNLAHPRAAGRALAELGEALVEVKVEAADAVAPPAHGELQRFHPSVPDPLAAVEQLPVDEESRAGIERLFREMAEVAPQVYAALPQQVTHNDYDPSNVLMDGDCVAGVLDWEFATRDVRAMDLAVALLGWAGHLFDTGREWAVLEAVGGGYVGHTALCREEVEALPLLFRLRAAATLIHRIGRYAQGLNTEAFMVRRVAGVLALEEWVRKNQARLTQVVGTG